TNTILICTRASPVPNRLGSNEEGDEFEFLKDDFHCKVNRSTSVREKVHAYGGGDVEKWEPIAFFHEGKQMFAPIEVAEGEQIYNHRSTGMHGFFGSAMHAKELNLHFQVQPMDLIRIHGETMRTNWRSWFCTWNLFAEDVHVKNTEQDYQSLGNTKRQDFKPSKDSSENTQDPTKPAPSPPAAAKKPLMTWKSSKNQFGSVDDFLRAVARHSLPNSVW